jgi:hypothetical protein
MDDKSLTTLLEARNDVDFEAFNMLRELDSEGLLCEEILTSGLRRVDPDKTISEAKEFAQSFYAAYQALAKKRAELDQAIVRAAMTVKS